MPDAWYYADRNGQLGPVSLQELKETLATLPNASDVLVWRDGFPGWKPAKGVVELIRQLSQPPPLPHGATRNWDKGRPAASKSPETAASDAHVDDISDRVGNLLDARSQQKFEELYPCFDCLQPINLNAGICPHCGREQPWAKARKDAAALRKGRIVLFSVIGVLVALVAIVANIGGKTQQTEVPLLTKQTDVPLLTKLEAVFVGRPSQLEIKRSMDQVLADFGHPSSEEEMSRLGNVLVRLRKETPGVTEMSLLQCMVAMKGALKPDYVGAAAICAGGLGTSRKTACDSFAGGELETCRQLGSECQRGDNMTRSPACRELFPNGYYLD